MHLVQMKASQRRHSFSEEGVVYGKSSQLVLVLQAKGERRGVALSLHASQSEILQNKPNKRRGSLSFVNRSFQFSRSTT